MDLQCKARASQLAERMSTPQQSLAAAVDLLERSASEKRNKLIQ